MFKIIIIYSKVLLKFIYKKLKFIYKLKLLHQIVNHNKKTYQLISTSNFETFTFFHITKTEVPFLLVGPLVSPTCEF